jgi:hypothetical protein
MQSSSCFVSARLLPPLHFNHKAEALCRQVPRQEDEGASGEVQEHCFSRDENDDDNNAALFLSMAMAMLVLVRSLNGDFIMFIKSSHSCILRE